jgi:hypothetical protein
LYLAFSKGSNATKIEISSVSFGGCEPIEDGSLFIDH